MKSWNVYPVGTINEPVRVDAESPYDAIMRAAAAMCMLPREFTRVEEVTS